MYDGHTSFGWSDPHKAYSVRVIEHADRCKPDELGVLAEDLLGPHSIEFDDYLEIPNIDDLESDSESGEFQDSFDMNRWFYDESVNVFMYDRFKHFNRSKLGGYPSWLQRAEWPINSKGERMSFVGQLDDSVGEVSPWAAGGFVYFFVDTSAEYLVGEMCIQTS